MESRTNKLISSALSRLLIKQIAHELKNHNLYKSFANFYSVEGYVDLQKYYEKRASEELNHHQWIFDYLSDGDCLVEYSVVDKNIEEFNTLNDPLNLTVKREIETTNLLYEIYEQALNEKDYMTASWLYEKLIREQIEEENTSRMAVTIGDMSCDWILKAEKIYELIEG